MELIFALLGTATPGGGFPVTAMRSPRWWMTENVSLLEANQRDVALVAGEIAPTARRCCSPRRGSSSCSIRACGAI